MKKNEFDASLGKKLKQLSGEERKKALDYYDELFADKLERGEGEESIIESFGTPEEIAARLISENSGMESQQITNIKAGSFVDDESIWDSGVRRAKTTAKGILNNRTFWIIYFSLFFVTIPLTIAAFSVLLSVCIAIFSIVISFAACCIAFMIGGVALVVIGAIACGTSAQAGIAQIGCGITLFGLGILFFEILKLLNYLRIWIFVKKVNREKARKNAEARMRTKRGLAKFLALLVIGVATFSVGFGMADWNIKKLDTTKYTPITQAIDSSVTFIDIDVDSRDVQIIPTTENFRVDTHTYKRSTLTITYENNVLTIKEKYKITFDDIIGYNMFTFANQNLRTIKVYVPSTFDKINAEMTSGDLTINDCFINEINVELTSGDLKINDCKISDIKAKMTSGDISIKNCETVKIVTQLTSGSTNISYCKVNILNARTTSGSINAKIIGDRREYSITSSVTSGYSNAGKNSAGSTPGKSITLKATSGDINLKFL